MNGYTDKKDGWMDRQTEQWKERWVEVRMRGQTVRDEGATGEGAPWPGRGCRVGSPHEPQGGHSLCPVPQEGVCRCTLLGPAFAPCHGLVDTEVYVAACTQDLCRCPTCPCATFAEYSRQCAHAGGQPQNWRGPDLCRECPGESRGRWPQA